MHGKVIPGIKVQPFDLAGASQNIGSCRIQQNIERRLSDTAALQPGAEPICPRVV
jgi:hypothetical protein